MKGSSLKSRPGSLDCPLCEVDKLDARGNSSAYCASCEGIVSGETLEALRQITDLPDALGRRACECGHPEMRLLLDGTYHCPSCGSEVVPLDAEATLSEPKEHGQAWWKGWTDARFGELSSSEARRAGSAPLLARARKVEP